MMKDQEYDSTRIVECCLQSHRPYHTVAAKRIEDYNQESQTT